MDQFYASRRDMAMKMSVEQWQQTGQAGKFWRYSRKAMLFQTKMLSFILQGIV
jgi:hypothetical protein